MKKLTIMLAICYITGGIVIAQNVISSKSTKSTTVGRHKRTATTLAGNCSSVSAIDTIGNECRWIQP